MNLPGWLRRVLGLKPPVPQPPSTGERIATMLEERDGLRPPAKPPERV